MEYKVEVVTNENQDKINIDIKKDDGDEQHSHTFSSTAKQSDNQCPICLDTFRHPKLLPCLHTFCLICIRTYMIKTKNKNQITCPLCRQSCRVMTANLDCILNNYFVESAVSVKLSKSCALCKKCDDDVIGCVHCDIDVCSECIILHERLSSQKEDMATEKYAVDRSRDTGYVRLPFHLVLSLPFIRTRVLTKQISCFSAIMRAQESGYVNSIYPDGQGRCWIIVDGGPEVVLYDINGREIRKVDSGSPLSDGVRTFDNSLLVAVFDGNRYPNEILKISPQGMVKSFVKYRNYKPAEISLFPDGRLVVAWFDDSEPGIERNRGAIHIYSSEGELLKDIGQTTDLSSLPFPFAVIVNPICGFINITDVVHGIVVILSEDGHLIGTYRGGSSFRDPLGLFIRLQNRFKPRGICCDLEGNVIVCDSGNNALHLLSPTGEFTGIISSEGDDGIGTPATVAVDEKGRIWIGDFHDGVVRVLEVKAYYNNFGREKEDSSPFQNKTKRGLT